MIKIYSSAFMMCLRPTCGSTLLLIGLHFLLSNHTLGSCQPLESASGSCLTFLVVASNRENGVEITVFPDELHTGLVDNRTYFIPDRSLPPECGAHYFHCQDLLVETVLPQDGGEMNVLFIPLKSGMAILSPLFTSEDGRLIEEWHTFVVDGPDCSPTVIYKVENGMFTLCINFTLQHIAVYEIQLHWNEKQVIDRAVFEGPLTRLSITNLSTSYISNFVLNVSSQVHKVYFAVDNTIYVMDVLDPTRTRKYYDLPQCQQIHKLTLADNYLLLAYCSDRYLYFSLLYGDWTQLHTYSRYGIPYLCPNYNYKVTFFNHTEGDFLKFTVTGSVQNITYNISISSSICFEIENTTYFTWSDPQHNSVFVFDFDSGNHFPISPYECSSMDCPQLLLFKNQYIVVHSDVNVFVIDAENNFELILNISFTISDILTALFVVKCRADNTTTLSPSTTISSTTLSPSTTISSTTLSPSNNTSTTYTTVVSTFTEVSSDSTAVSPFTNTSITTVGVIHNGVNVTVIIACIVTIVSVAFLMAVVLITLCSCYLRRKRQRQG